MNQKLAAIKKGCALNDKIFSLLVKKLRAKEFRTEKQVADFINIQIKNANAKNAFPAIVASGKNAVEWHHKPAAKKLLNGFCVIDFGSRFNGYCSDMTRTVYLGMPSKTEKRLYKLVLETQEKCIRRIKAGARADELYFFAKKKLSPYGDYFDHGLGHGLGKKVHSKPKIGRKKALLKENDVVTIEPGIYIPKILGIRIEDDVLVTKKGYRILSKSTKRFLESNAQ